MQHFFWEYCNFFPKWCVSKIIAAYAFLKWAPNKVLLKASKSLSRSYVYITPYNYVCKNQQSKVYKHVKHKQKQTMRKTLIFRLFSHIFLSPTLFIYFMNIKHCFSTAVNWQHVVCRIVYYVPTCTYTLYTLCYVCDYIGRYYMNNIISFSVMHRYSLSTYIYRYIYRWRFMAHCIPKKEIKSNPKKSENIY